MTHILFLVYTAVFTASFFVGGNDIHIVIGIMSEAAMFFGWLRRFYFAHRGYYVRKYVGAVLRLALLLPYAIWSYRVASIICYACIAGSHYLLPALRLIALRIFYMGSLKKACRGRNHQVRRVRGGVIVHTPERVYDIRVIGSLRRLGHIVLKDSRSYTKRWMPTYAVEKAHIRHALTEDRKGVDVTLWRILVGKARTHTLVWSDGLAENPNAERVLLFLPGLCEWRFNTDEQTVTNGSLRYGVRLYDADAFIEKLR